MNSIQYNQITSNDLTLINKNSKSQDDFASLGRCLHRININSSRWKKIINAISTANEHSDKKQLEKYINSLTKYMIRHVGKKKSFTEKELKRVRAHVRTVAKTIEMFKTLTNRQTDLLDTEFSKLDETLKKRTEEVALKNIQGLGPRLENKTASRPVQTPLQEIKKTENAPLKSSSLKCKRWKILGIGLAITGIVMAATYHPYGPIPPLPSVLDNIRGNPVDLECVGIANKINNDNNGTVNDFFKESGLSIDDFCRIPNLPWSPNFMGYENQVLNVAPINSAITRIFIPESTYDKESFGKEFYRPGWKYQPNNPERLSIVFRTCLIQNSYLAWLNSWISTKKESQISILTLPAIRNLKIFGRPFNDNYKFDVDGDQVIQNATDIKQIITTGIIESHVYGGEEAYYKPKNGDWQGRPDTRF